MFRDNIDIAKLFSDPNNLRTISWSKKQILIGQIIDDAKNEVA